ncbi:MAG: hypothetical protein FWH32_07005 [Clostridiales bacterium]|nr:hypothetical protein [Clostridiales bacterium]
MEDTKEQIDEQQLEAAAGGWTINQYDPESCSKLKKEAGKCRGFKGLFFPCDHYSLEWIGNLKCRIKCKMGMFDYIS